MTHSIGDGLIVLALAAMVIAWLYFRHMERRRRLEVIHSERLVAMDKGFPLPELPLDPPPAPRQNDARAVLLHGLVWVSLGGGGLVALRVWAPDVPTAAFLWPATLPLVTLGLGLILYYVLAKDRQR